MYGRSFSSVRDAPFVTGAASEDERRVVCLEAVLSRVIQYVVSDGVCFVSLAEDAIEEALLPQAPPHLPLEREGSRLLEALEKADQAGSVRLSLSQQVDVIGHETERHEIEGGLRRRVFQKIDALAALLEVGEDRKVAVRREGDVVGATAGVGAVRQTGPGFAGGASVGTELKLRPYMVHRFARLGFGCLGCGSLGSRGVWRLVHALFAALRKARIFVTSFAPSVSTPLATSTAQGWTVRMASATLSGVRPPASHTGISLAIPAATPQSKTWPVPPRALASALSRRMAMALPVCMRDMVLAASSSPATWTTLMTCRAARRQWPQGSPPESWIRSRPTSSAISLTSSGSLLAKMPTVRGCLRASRRSRAAAPCSNQGPSPSDSARYSAGGDSISRSASGLPSACTMS